MSEQLALALDVVTISALPRPRGLREIEINGVRYLHDVGGEDWFRVMGWYYGYPPCCVDAFIERHNRVRAAHREWLDRQPPDTPIFGTADDPRPEQQSRPHHPLSGHLLCLACEVGPIAPLPPRPAERYGFMRFDDNGLPVFAPPSTYSWKASTSA